LIIREADAQPVAPARRGRALSGGGGALCGAEIRHPLNSIHPGYVWTPQTEKFLGDVGLLEQEKAKALSRHPIGFLGEPRDIAYMVLYLASDESRFVTGSEMVIDGGYLMV
jgi:NAD(P)-dependent dehydrogenase (short-subunit alcohol dehydrogenase family)